MPWRPSHNPWAGYNHCAKNMNRSLSSVVGAPPDGIYLIKEPRGSSPALQTPGGWMSHLEQLPHIGRGDLRTDSPTSRGKGNVGSAQNRRNHPALVFGTNLWSLLLCLFVWWGSLGAVEGCQLRLLSRLSAVLKGLHSSQSSSTHPGRMFASFHDAFLCLLDCGLDFYKSYKKTQHSWSQLDSCSCGERRRQGSKDSMFSRAKSSYSIICADCCLIIKEGVN